ncbi:MAG: alpha-amylase, partial [Chitinophagaceae bacterium]|nr:alpha-amylase [Chitinophagaceae bacterium]
QDSRGYDVYDIYDLGEFEQKGTIRTRYGTKEEYLQAVETLKKAGIQVYVDVVVNHLSGADEVEKVKIRKVNPENRNEFISDSYDIEAYTKFTFPGRNNKYSSFIWDQQCFSGVDYANDTKETGIYSIQNQYGDGWEEMIDEEKGNFDYLMGADIEFRNSAVREEFKNWGAWYWNLIKFDGVRMDAVKHITPGFFAEWLDHINHVAGKELFAVGEYWAPEQLGRLTKFIEATGGRMSLFDAPLHHNFFTASKAGRDYDLTTIFNGSLVETKPLLSVTIIDNHDTQPLQALEAPVEVWFKPIAYALILLREGGYPCVFYPDLYGASYVDKDCNGTDCEIHLPPVEHLEKLLTARKVYAYGIQRDCFNHANCIAWSREGDEEHENSACAVVMSNGEEGLKDVEVGKRNAGHTFIDFLGNREEEVIVNEDGWGNFSCNGGSVSVWVRK